MEKGKSINFSDYVDRDIPYIKNNVLGIDPRLSNTPGKQQFDTKIENKSGLFSKFKGKADNKSSFNNA